MARRKPYIINSFYGGMTDDIRNTSDLSKCAYISHFDIYRDPSQAYAMPGYLDDMNDGSTATGMKQYDIRAFRYYSGGLYAVGTKSDGTGSKLFSKATPTTASWTAVTSGEGTDNLAAYTFLNGTSSSNQYWLTIDGTNDLNVTFYNGGSTTDAYGQVQAVIGDPDDGVISKVRAFNDAIYFTIDGIDSEIGQINGATFTGVAKDTSIFAYDYASGDEQIGIFGYRTFPSRAQLLLWDSASILIDRKIEFGTGRGACIGYVNGVWVGVVNEGLDVRSSSFFDGESNDTASMAIKAASGAGAETLYRIFSPTTTNAVVKALDGVHRDAWLFYARVPTDPTPTTYREGVWAVGKAGAGYPLAISVLMDTGSLGLIETYHNFGQHHYFGHAEDGSISRLDTIDGTYDVPAIYESLVFGAESPYQKELEGISVITENLPASASIQVYYRTDVDSSWTSMGTSSTTDKQKHSFTKKSDATPIGKFQEIQFKVVATGKIVLKNITISITETDDLPFTV